MKIILGLGNPGEEYANTRHNAGILLVERLVSGVQCLGDYGWRRRKNILVAEFPELILVKTAGYFMNESGSIARDFFKTSPLTSLLNLGEGNKKEGFFLAHDDLDLRLGECKIQFGKGPKEHNGVESVENALGTKGFWRIRIGIDNRQTSNPKSQEPNNNQYSTSSVQRIPGEEYVLQKFLKEEREVLDKVLEKIAHEVIEANTR